ncbi:MAG: hypothetical protein A6D91_04310 [Bacillaceae bacterium G1]|nr:hypothetical protein [Bacillota bacterium]OJF17159.1 MAG: hypothetical protein A6D91_04310 [Bacillaceae bacterium G1]
MRHDGDDSLLMTRRIEAFYRQSGGPGNPLIDRLLEEHLLYGKDHGVRGRKEEIKDAFIEVFLNDHSTRPIVLALMKFGHQLRKEWQAYLNALANSRQIQETTQSGQR